MVSEFDLPCTACGEPLARSTIRPDDDVPVAVCSRCGTRHYPEATLETLEERRARRGSDPEGHPEDVPGAGTEPHREHGPE